MADIFVQDEKS